MNRIATCLLTCALAALATRAAAGPLATAPNAYVDNAFVTWHGSTPLQGFFDPPGNTLPSGLTGYVDWAVFAPGVLPAGFAGYGAYVPTPTEYLYTYQATITGSAPLSSLAVELILGSWVDNIGQFTATGISGDPSIFSFLVTNDSANWAFDGVGGTSNAVTTTLGLAFSSPDVPQSSSGTSIDDGTFGPLALLPAPVLHVPEPASLALAASGVAMAALAWVGRNRRRSDSSRSLGVRIET